MNKTSIADVKKALKSYQKSLKEAEDIITKGFEGFMRDIRVPPTTMEELDIYVQDNKKSLEKQRKEFIHLFKDVADKYLKVPIILAMYAHDEILSQFTDSFNVNVFDNDEVEVTRKINLRKLIRYLRSMSEQVINNGMNVCGESVVHTLNVNPGENDD